ncbi:uncharacterized protein RJT21DRAFT_133696 [Scheffersomyces amazonensis]|uniref:uncharacterized protein n=1 Tax=Scheffersomyces amazonensis TaxID=1078765 RepID=UPI00315D00FF
MKMRLLYSFISFYLLALTFAFSDIEFYQDNQLLTRDVSDLEELVEYLNTLPSSLDKRSNKEFTPLTQICTVLNTTGWGVQAEHDICTSSVTSGVAIKSINSFLQHENLTTILVALDQSNLALDVVMEMFIDPSLLPGLWTVLKSLWSSGVIHLKRDVNPEFEKRQNVELTAEEVEIAKRGILDFLGGIFNTAENLAINTLVTLVTQIADVGSICISLEKSGLGVSVIREALEPSDMQKFTVNLLTTIIQDKTVTLDELIQSLEQSGIVINTIKKILANTTDLRIIFVWAVKQLVSFIQYVL